MRNRKSQNKVYGDEEFLCTESNSLILAFAVTIHKSQGLSLDNAIIDLSDRVFSPGMAYVALSRVRTLSGVHLPAFQPSSIQWNLHLTDILGNLYMSFIKRCPLEGGW